MPQKTHGMTREPDGRRGSTYTVWQAMKFRCANPKAQHFARYGGRGIRVCEHWLSFENFFADMGERPAGTTLDRHPDNDGNYEPGNCRWASRKSNSRNRADNRVLTFDGRSMTLTEWSETTGHSRATLQGRVNMGWTDERILATPSRSRTSNRVLTINGVGKPLAQWCKERGLSPRTVRHRLSKQGMTPAEALGL